MLARNVLIFHGGALGDFVLSWPLALALARLFPQSRLFYIVPGQKGRLAERVLRVEWAGSEAGWHGLFSDDARLSETASKILNGAHTIVSFLGSVRTVWAANVRSIVPSARLSLLNPIPPPAYPAHAVEYLLDQLADWPAAQATARQILHGINERGIMGISTKPQAVVIHPGSGSQEKNWPIDKFLELAAGLIVRGRRTHFLLGEVERELWPAASIARLEAIAPVHRPQTYLELLAELASAEVFVGNDSGPAHLSGIVGRPTVALFGPTSAIQWRPLGPRVQTLDGPLDRIEVAEVLNVIQHLGEP